ncbi:hypothetical protein HAX54_046205, partial [Datura stramonium]|nr:hypothetical protein [Datura stramonium]
VHEARQSRKGMMMGRIEIKNTNKEKRGEGGNQEFELDDDNDKEGGNQENNNGDEDKKEKEETEEEIEEEEEEKREGGPSDTPEGNQIHNDSAKDDTELTDHGLTNDYHYDNDDHQDLAILKSIWHFNCNSVYIPYPHSDVIYNHIMDSIPNLNILGEDLTKKIIAFENNFNVVWELDGDNPYMA